MGSAVVDATLISDVVPESPAARAGLREGDRIVSVNGLVPRDIIEWHRLMAESSVAIEVDRDGESMTMTLEAFGEPSGVSVASALFDRVQTCDNHCEFCFIYQLPKGMRRSLYLKDDDYRLSFLFGNFTTLTRFTEADLERVVDERLSPLYVSVHATDPADRSTMLRNERGGTSLRWLGQLLDHGISVRAQIVLCPGVNDGQVLDSTLSGMLERFPSLESVAIVPLGLSRFNTESRMRVHTPEECLGVIAHVTAWQERYVRVLARQPLFLADEFYIVAGVPVPDGNHYGDFPMLEDGIGLARRFIDEFNGVRGSAPRARDGFFTAFDSRNPTQYVSGPNPAASTGLRPSHTPVNIRRVPRDGNLPPTILTGAYGATLIGPLVAAGNFQDVEVRTVENRWFGGNTAVAGLLTFDDVRTAIESGDRNRTFLLPDVCLNDDRFLDGHTVSELDAIANVEVLETSGTALRERLLRHRIGDR